MSTDELVDRISNARSKSTYDRLCKQYYDRNPEGGIIFESWDRNKSNEIQKIIEQAGGASAFAELTGIPRRTVFRWKAGTSLPQAWVVPLIRSHISAGDVKAM